MIKKILVYGLALIVVAIAALFTYVSFSWDKQYDEWPAPALKSSTDSAIIARGKYLVNGPAHCNSCHVSSIKDLEDSDKGMPIPLKGGVSFPLGPLGNIVSRNLTPDKNTGWKIFG
jgi:hypothetical protein